VDMDAPVCVVEGSWQHESNSFYNGDMMQYVFLPTVRSLLEERVIA
jgi:hypothetical protein